MSVRRVSRHNYSCNRVDFPAEAAGYLTTLNRPTPSRPFKRFFSPRTQGARENRKITGTGVGNAPTVSLVEIITSGEPIAISYLYLISQLRFVLRGGR